MKAIKVYEQDGNRTVGIFQESNGDFTALTFSQSKTFKRLSAAEKWLAKFL